MKTIVIEFKDGQSESYQDYSSHEIVGGFLHLWLEVEEVDEGEQSDPYLYAFPATDVRSFYIFTTGVSE